MENKEKFIQRKVPEKEALEGKEELPPNVVMVETEKAKFLIAYGRHTVEMEPEELGKADAWVPELGGIDYTLPKKLVEEKINEGYLSEYNLQYGKLVKKVKEERKPIFLADVTEIETIKSLRIGSQVLESAVAGALIGSLLLDYSKGEKWTEIETLKTIASIYFSSEMIEGILGVLFDKLRHGVIDEKSLSRAIERFIGDLNERIHPETKFAAITLRNSLFAQKMETIAEKLSPEIKNRKPEVAITVGASHHGIERALKKEDKKRVWLIDKLLSAPGLKKIREKIATIARFDFNKEKDKWELIDRFKDPHLAKIEK